MPPILCECEFEIDHHGRLCPPTHYEECLSSLTSYRVSLHVEGLGDGAYGLSSLSEKTV